MSRPDRNRVGGGALVVGFTLVLVVLFRSPERGLAAATADPAAALYFLVLPALGVLAGLYAALDAPFGAAALFAFGSYLGVLGVALSFGAAVSPAAAPLPLGVGLLAVALAAAALVVSVLRLASAARLLLPRVDVDPEP